MRRPEQQLQIAVAQYLCLALPREDPLSPAGAMPEPQHGAFYGRFWPAGCSQRQSNRRLMASRRSSQSDSQPSSLGLGKVCTAKACAGGARKAGVSPTPFCPLAPRRDDSRGRIRRVPRV